MVTEQLLTSRNTIIVLTSNSGTSQLREFGRGWGYERVEGELTGEIAEGIVMKVLEETICSRIFE